MGGYSQINCELRLLEEAKRVGYDYYHILSGIDFPIKSMSYIHKFFEEYSGYEFVHFDDENFTNANAGRYEKYHFFQEYIGRRKTGNLYMIERKLITLQSIIRINRSLKYPDIVFKLGSNWCSLTHKFVEYLLSREKNIRKMFAFTVCCDECFVQTILYNSEFKKNIFMWNNNLDVEIRCLRSIDWKRGNPYTYKEDDYDELVQSRNLFCRKVSDEAPEYEGLLNKLELL